MPAKLQLAKISLNGRNNEEISKIFNSICASKISGPISYIFFLDNNGRYVADAFFLAILAENMKFFENSSKKFDEISEKNSDENFENYDPEKFHYFLATFPEIFEKLQNHLKKIDFRKQIKIDRVESFFAYMVPDSIAKNSTFFGLNGGVYEVVNELFNSEKNLETDCAFDKQTFVFNDPRNLGKIILTNSLPKNLEKKLNFEHENMRIMAEIAEFYDFENSKIPLEYGKISKFISSEKGCYCGQEIIQKIRVLGQIRKTVKTIPNSELSSHEIIKILAKNEDFSMILTKI